VVIIMGILAAVIIPQISFDLNPPPMAVDPERFYRSGEKCNAGPHPHVSESSTEIQHCVCDWIPKRKKCCLDPPKDSAKQRRNGSAFLGSRIVREHSWIG